MIRHAGDHRRRVRRAGHHDPEGVRHLHQPVAHRHLHPVRRRGLCGRRGPRHRAVLSHRETRRPLHPCEHQTLHRHIRILGRQPDRPRLQRFDCRIGHRRDRRSDIHLADHHRKLALDRLGSVVDRHPDGVRRRPLGLRRQPSQLALAGYRQTDRTAEESEGQRLDGQIRIRGGKRALEQLQLVHRKGRIARPHRRLIDLAHPDLEQVGDRDLTVADGNQERMDLGALGFGRSPSNLARGAQGQARRSRDQPVGQRLNRLIGIARGHLPNRFPTLGPLRRLGIEPYRRLIVLDHIHLEGHPTADLTVRRLGHDRPAGAPERFAGLPGPPAAGRHRESRGSAHQRPSQRSLQVGIRRSQRRTGGPVLHHAGIREGNHHRIDPRGGHGDHSAALHVRHSVAQLHAEGIVSGDVRSTRRPLQQAAGRQGDPGRCLQQSEDQRLLRKIAVPGGEQLLQGLALDHHQLREGVEHGRIVEDGRGNHRHIAQLVIGCRDSGEEGINHDQGLVGPEQRVGEAHLTNFESHRVTAHHPVDLAAGHRGQCGSVEGLVRHRHPAREDLGLDSQSTRQIARVVFTKSSGLDGVGAGGRRQIRPPVVGQRHRNPRRNRHREDRQGRSAVRLDCSGQLNLHRSRTDVGSEPRRRNQPVVGGGDSGQFEVGSYLQGRTDGRP